MIRTFFRCLYTLLILGSCQEKDSPAALPKAAFTYQADLENPLKVSFKDESEHNVRNEWDFGDGRGASSERNPIYVYSDEGAYNVILTVYNSDGVSSDTSIVVKITWPDSRTTWELDFEENFQGSEVSPNNWYIYNSPGHTGNGLRRPEAFTVADGLLTLTAQMRDGQLVSGGMAHTKNYRYGKFEARVRADDDPDKATSAVLLTWPQSERWPIDGENDFYETTTNRRQSFHTFIHYGQDNRQYHKEHLFDAKKWHVIAMEWAPRSIKVYVDGELQWTLTDEAAIPDVPHHLCIQLDAFTKTMSGSTRMQVDWVKIYKYSSQK